MFERWWSRRHLVFSLVHREYRVRYRQSTMGVLWAVILPIVSVAAATLVFHRVVGVSSGGVSYPLFAFAGLAPWTFLASSLTFGVPSVIGASQTITRIPFPRAALPLAMIGTALIDLSIATATFIVFVYATGNSLPITAAWYPVVFFIELILVIGVVLFGSALNVFARDVKLLLPLVIPIWLFLTPVMYPLESVPADLRPFYLMNPMTGIVETFRDILIAGVRPEFSVIWPSIVGAVTAIVLGIWYFSATERRFADVI